MYTKNELNAILNFFTDNVKTALGDKLTDIILYGSYARGNGNEESDIDVMVLIDAPHKDTESYVPSVLDAAIKAGWNYGAFISANVASGEHFKRYRDTMPYFKNIAEEGVNLLARR